MSEFLHLQQQKLQSFWPSSICELLLESYGTAKPLRSPFFSLTASIITDVHLRVLSDAAMTGTNELKTQLLETGFCNSSPEHGPSGYHVPSLPLNGTEPLKIL